MSTIPASSSIPFVTFGQVVSSLPDIPLSRIRLSPRPGTATEADVVEIRNKEKTLCELFDGVLVEKPMEHNESIIAGYILTAINIYLESRDLGRAAGEASMLRLAAGQVRMPDVSFVSRSQFPSGQLPREPIWNTYPDLAVEVLSESNTTREIARKISEYFAAASRLVWVVDPVARTVAVYRSVTELRVCHLGDTLDGADVLPGFVLPVAKIFRD